MVVRVVLLALLVFLTAGASCQGTNPFAVAESAEQRAFAAYGTYVATQKGALVIVEDPTTPQNVREAIADADRVAKPAADRVKDGALLLIAIKEELQAGEDTESRLVIATTRLQGWVNEARPLITDLQALVRKHR